MPRTDWTLLALWLIGGVAFIFVAFEIWDSMSCLEWRVIPGKLQCWGIEFYKECEPMKECIRRRM